MEYDFVSVIRAINEVNENIWLGDLKKAVEIADSNLKVVKIETAEPERADAKLSRILKQKRKEAKQKDVKNRRLWVAEQLSKTAEKIEIDMVENLFWVLYSSLSDLREAIAYLVESSSQTTMETFADRSAEDEPQLQTADRYRYIVQRLPDRWETRAILNDVPSQWDVARLRSALSDYGLSVAEISKGRYSKVFELYSRDMYAQVLSQDNQVEILVYTPETPDAKQRVYKIVEVVLRVLSQ